jgi:hypothetical protein
MHMARVRQTHHAERKGVRGGAAEDGVHIHDGEAVVDSEKEGDAQQGLVDVAAEALPARMIPYG